MRLCPALTPDQQLTRIRQFAQRSCKVSMNKANLPEQIVRSQSLMTLDNLEQLF